MKTNLLFLMMIGLSFSLHSFYYKDNPVKVNSKIENAFKTRYTNVGKVKWEKKRNHYKAEFNVDRQDVDAWYDEEGQWHMTKTEMQYNQLPENIRTAFSSGKYNRWKIDDIHKIERLNRETVYVLEIQMGNEEQELFYTPEGNLVKEVAERKTEKDYYNYLPANLPGNIQTYINNNYPNAKIIDTDIENNRIEVDLRDGKMHREVVFRADGSWMHTKTKMHRDEVPQNIMTSLKSSEFGNERIDDIDYYESSQNKYYLFELDSRPRDKKVMVSPEGKVEIYTR